MSWSKPLTLTGSPGRRVGPGPGRAARAPRRPAGSSGGATPSCQAAGLQRVGEDLASAVAVVGMGQLGPGVGRHLVRLGIDAVELVHLGSTTRTSPSQRRSPSRRHGRVRRCGPRAPRCACAGRRPFAARSRRARSRRRHGPRRRRRPPGSAARGRSARRVVPARPPRRPRPRESRPGACPRLDRRGHVGRHQVGVGLPDHWLVAPDAAQVIARELVAAGEVLDEDHRRGGAEDRLKLRQAAGTLVGGAHALAVHDRQCERGERGDDDVRLGQDQGLGPRWPARRTDPRRPRRPRPRSPPR